MRFLPTTRALGALAVTLLAGAVAVTLQPASAVAEGKSAATLLFPGFFGVAATSARNAWAVGEYQSGTVQRTLIVHWDGRGWRQVPSPNPVPGGALLYAVAAASATSAWAVGTDFYNLTDANVIEHWNGKTWALVHSPIVDGQLAGVAVTSAANAWAVGTGDAGATILHWDGHRWSGITLFS